MGESHIAKAKEFNGKLKAEIVNAKRQANECPTKGIKNISRSIGGPKAKPLMGVFRDRDTPDGGKAGQMTSDPAEIDAVVKRAWKAVYDGMQGCILKAVENYLEIYSKYILRMPEAKIDLLDGHMVFDSFRQIKESAAALDGWSPKELSLLSLQACGNVADMLNQIEAGSPWPRSATHALIAYLEKEGAELGYRNELQAHYDNRPDLQGLGIDAAPVT